MSVTALADDILGLTAYMDIGALNRLLREGASVNALLLSVDSSFADDVWKRLRDFPAIEAFTPRETIFAAFNDTIAGMILVSSAFLAGFGVLIAAGLMRAKVLVVSYADTVSTLKILRHAQELRPELSVVVRTRDDSDIDRLKEAGATEVVAEIMEGSLMLTSHALMFAEISTGRILRRIRAIREQRYSLLRGFYYGVTDEADDGSEKLLPRLLTITIIPGAAAIGKTLGEIDLSSLAVEVTAVRRRNIRGSLPTNETRLEMGDVVVLRGTQENLAAAEIKLLQG